MTTLSTIYDEDVAGRKGWKEEWCEKLAGDKIASIDGGIAQGAYASICISVAHVCSQTFRIERTKVAVGNGNFVHFVSWLAACLCQQQRMRFACKMGYYKP